MNLLAIVTATLCAGIGSVFLAALLLRVGGSATGDAAGSGAQHLLSLAAGALMATAFLHLLPEAFESGAEAHVLFTVLLVGLVFFFLLDKAELWHHGHEHHAGHTAAGDGEHGPAHDGEHSHADGDRAHRHEHAHAHDDAAMASHPHAVSKSGGWAVLAGDSVHCFGDGVLIASAFMADLRLGLVAALSVLAHEVPHHMGDLVVLRMTSGSRRQALLKVSLAGAVTTIGGITGWWLVEQLHHLLPYLLVVASSSFVYVALADLIPQLQRRLGARATVTQVGWLVAGIAMVSAVSSALHASH